MRLEDDELMASFDIVSLYPNIPLSHAFIAIKNWLQTTPSRKISKKLSQIEIDTITKATKLCLNLNQFRFRSNFYKLKDGTCMGNPLSCFVGNIFMCVFETELGSFRPRIWHRYVDDLFAIIKTSQKEELLKILNGSKKYTSIKFTKI